MIPCMSYTGFAIHSGIHPIHRVAKYHTYRPRRVNRHVVSHTVHARQSVQWSLVRETEGSDRHSHVRLRLRHRPRRPSREGDIRRPWRSAPSFRAVLACCMPPGSFASALWSPQARSSRQRQAPAARPATALATAWPPRTRARRRLSPRRWLTTSCRSLRRRTSCAPMHRHPGLYGRP